jgi:glycosyltransferase involved in cell wall biosynthesis
MSTSLRWLFLSNMFPSAKDQSYGAFVARSLDDLLAEAMDIRHVVVIRGRQERWQKLRAYGRYFRDLLVVGIFGSIDAIYAHYASHHCLPIALLSIVFRKRLILHIHGDDLAVRVGWIRAINRTGQGLLVRRADLIVVPSVFFAEMLRSIYPQMDPSKVVISPSSGVDTTAFDTHEAVKDPNHWNLALSVPMVRVGFVGRIDADKGWALLTQAWFMLPPEQRARVHLSFWGGGQQAFDLEKRVAEIGPTNATFHGQVSPERVPDVHRQFDIHVVPSYRESLGLSAIEGMAAGHIVLCSDIRPFIDFTKNGREVLHFRTGDSTSLRDALSRALYMPSDQAARMSSMARRLALDYDRRAVAHQLSSSIKHHLCHTLTSSA